ncbi:uncharacterized protein F5147DRAFT_771909 [Suillus discolor]|uniref:F-box domain-containing protein n=1 Tax=Suillus discolor TaxID=1912936 RepID=A0A9P7JVR8_9AGAM|nr:uncharacterized protein F5147DRAFT_771909 [Suillus discolor]KAG2111176.1 hypothetical protein F5147DRAFT_771909 [Suillus discolor]
MHPALQNLEIICTISSYVKHSSLPSFASTCRAFERPALNALWRDLQSVKPVVKCLPRNLFGSGLEGGVALREPLDDRMWHTLVKYTSRVHSITVLDDMEAIDLLCAIILSCSSAPASLFPNLHKLKWHASGTHCAAQVLRMVFVPSLLELNMDIPSASSAFLSVLSTLGTSCPRLQNMSLNYGPSFPILSFKASPFITRSISQLHHLHTLSVCDLGIQGIKHLTELRALESLSLKFTDPSDWDTVDLSFPGFHNLQSLGLSTVTMEQASSFLSSLQFVRTKEIRVDFVHQDESTAIPQLFAIIQERCDNDKLESISLHGDDPEDTHTGQSIFAPLYACRNLTQLLIGSVCYISMSNKELGRLATAWPKLQVLQIKCYPSDDSIMPTFHGLITLLGRCPALTSITLVINVTKFNGIDLKSPGGGCRNERLKFLALGNSPIKVPVNVALIISGLFPNLKKVDFWDAYPTVQKKSVKQQWELVNSIIGGFSLVEERSFGIWSDL